MHGMRVRHNQDDRTHLQITNEIKTSTCDTDRSDTLL
jgi:hypothetical protein